MPNISKDLLVLTDADVQATLRSVTFTFTEVLVSILGSQMLMNIRLQARSPNQDFFSTNSTHVPVSIDVGFRQTDTGNNDSTSSEGQRLYCRINSALTCSRHSFLLNELTPATRTPGSEHEICTIEFVLLMSPPMYNYNCPIRSQSEARIEWMPPTRRDFPPTILNLEGRAVINF